MESLLFINLLAWALMLVATLADGYSSFRIREADPSFVEANPITRPFVHGGHEGLFYLVAIGFHLGGGLYWHDMLQDLEGKSLLMPVAGVLIVGASIKIALNVAMFIRHTMRLV